MHAYGQPPTPAVEFGRAGNVTHGYGAVQFLNCVLVLGQGVFGALNLCVSYAVWNGKLLCPLSGHGQAGNIGKVFGATANSPDVRVGAKSCSSLLCW